MTLLLLLVAFWRPALSCEPAEARDGLQAWVVTTGPGAELFTRLGHTALWISDPDGRDRVFNWGAFDPSQDNLAGKFLNGELEYYLMTEPWQRTRRRAVRNDRELIVQRLDLPPEMLSLLRAQLKTASLPENKSYAYNWLTQNCTSKVRDLIDRITGEALTAQADPVGPSARHEVLRHLQSFPLWFGWHFATSDLTDLPLQGMQTMLAPDAFMEGIAGMSLTWPDGEVRPLVAETCTLETGLRGMPRKQAPSHIPPLGAASLLLAGLISLGGRGSRPGRWLSGLLTLILGLLAGTMGLASSVLWGASTLEGFGPNENWWVASPASLLLVPAGLGLCFAAPWTRHFVPWVKLLGLGACIAVLSKILPMADQDNAAILTFFVPPLLAVAWVFHRWSPTPPEHPAEAPEAATQAPPPDHEVEA